MLYNIHFQVLEFCFRSEAIVNESIQYIDNNLWKASCHVCRLIELNNGIELDKNCLTSCE